MCGQGRGVTSVAGGMVGTDGGHRGLLPVPEGSEVARPMISETPAEGGRRVGGGPMCAYSHVIACRFESDGLRSWLQRPRQGPRTILQPDSQLLPVLALLQRPLVQEMADATPGKAVAPAAGGGNGGNHAPCVLLWRAAVRNVSALKLDWR